MKNIPYMVAVGNHEAECYSPICLVSQYKQERLGNYSAYNARFRMPSKESNGIQNMWYSFDHGPLHIITISSETDFEGAPTNSYLTGGVYGKFGNQLAWLKADLEKASKNRGNTPWILVGSHRPIYTVNECDESGTPVGQSLALQKAMEELFLEYKVDAFLVGHHHAYERHTPIARGKAMMDGVNSDKTVYQNPQAPVYIVTGAGGNSEGHESYATSKKPEWRGVVDETHYGISTVKVTKTCLEWKFIDSISGATLDQFQMIKT